MKLTQRLVMTIVGSIVLLLLAVGSAQVVRETMLFENDVARDHQLLGRALSASLREDWASRGDAYADHLSAALAKDAHLGVRWIRAPDALAARAGFQPVRARDWLSLLFSPLSSSPSFRTIAPVEVDGRTVGAFEIEEPAEEILSYIRRTAWVTAAIAAIVTLLAAALVTALGAKYVGRPTRRLIEKARRIGAGDFRGELIMTTGDELEELACELNVMSEQLAESRARLELEHKALVQALESLRHAGRLATIGQIASCIAHELGTPLMVICSRAEMLLGPEPLLDRVEECATIIRQQVDRLTRIVRQLLDFGRPRAPKKSQQDLSEIVARTVRFLSPLARIRKVALEQGAKKALLIEVDQDQVEQVLTNLVVNGIQATSAGGRVFVDVEPTLALHPEAPPNAAPLPCLTVHVRDTGSGMSAADQTRLFEPFFTTKPTGEGTGLGLSVAHGIVAEHGGFITVRSVEGTGSTFSVHLPLSLPGAPRSQTKPSSVA